MSTKTSITLPEKLSGVQTKTRAAATRRADSERPNMPKTLEVRDARHRGMMRDIEIVQGMGVTGITLDEAKQLVEKLPLLIARLESEYVWRGIDWREVSAVLGKPGDLVVTVQFRDGRPEATLEGFPGEGLYQKAFYYFSRTHSDA